MEIDHGVMHGQGDLPVVALWSWRIGYRLPRRGRREAGSAEEVVVSEIGWPAQYEIWQNGLETESCRSENGRENIIFHHLIGLIDIKRPLSI